MCLCWINFIVVFSCERLPILTKERNPVLYKFKFADTMELHNPPLSCRLPRAPKIVLESPTTFWNRFWEHWSGKIWSSVWTDVFCSCTDHAGYNPKCFHSIVLHLLAGVLQSWTSSMQLLHAVVITCTAVQHMDYQHCIATLYSMSRSNIVDPKQD